MKLLKPLISLLICCTSTISLGSSFVTEKWTTPNGVQVVFYHAMEVPMLDVSIAFAAGSAYDGKQFGLSALTTLLLDDGNSGQNADELAEALAESGAQFNADTSRDMVTLNLRTLSEPKVLEQSTALFAKIINHPDFPQEAFKREKQQLLMAIEQSKDSPEDMAMVEFFKRLYGDHPYAHPVNGTTQTVGSITKEQVLAFYKKYFIANNATLVMVGAIDASTAHQLADKLTKELPNGPAAPVTAPTKPLQQAEEINIPFPSSQTIIRLGQLGINHKDPNYFPLVVGNYILGGGGALNSRLAVEVREKRGLTYGIDSQLVPMPGNGPFIISLSTKKNQAKAALGITQEVLNKYLKEGPSVEELEAAKKYLTGSFPLSLASNKNIAALLLRMAFFKLPDDYLDTYLQQITQVTNKQILVALQELIKPEKLLLVTVGSM